MQNKENTVINIDVLKAALDKEIEKVEEQNKNPLTETLFSLKEQILMLRTKKLSWQKIATVLNDNGLKVSASNLGLAFKDDADFQKVKKVRKQKETS